MCSNNDCSQNKGNIMKIEKSKPTIISTHKTYLHVNVCGKDFKINKESYDKIKDMSFYWSKRVSNVYPVTQYQKSPRSLKYIINGKCHIINTDKYDLRSRNLMETCKIVDIDEKTIKVHIGNGKTFLADKEQTDYLKGYKWSLLELKPTYWYVARMQDKKLYLLHRHVMQVSSNDTSRHVDHINWVTTDNRKANLQLLTMSENIHRRNPAKPTTRRRKRKVK